MSPQMTIQPGVEEEGLETNKNIPISFNDIFQKECRMELQMYQKDTIDNEEVAVSNLAQTWKEKASQKAAENSSN